MSDDELRRGYDEEYLLRKPRENEWNIGGIVNRLTGDGVLSVK